MAALGEAVAAAFASARLAQGPVAAACLGLAGSGRPEDQDAIRAWADKARLAERVEVTSDGALLLAAGTPEGWGLGLVAGTGSIAVGRTADGRMARAGGWGYLLGDEGSGYALVTAAMRAVARSADGRGPTTRLTERFLTRLGLRQPPELVSAVYGGSWDRAALASLAPLVTALAAEDEVASAIVDEAARELAETAAAVVHQFGWGTVRVPLALAGGLLLADADYRQRVSEALKRLGIAVGPIDLVAEPAAGAVRLALRETVRS
jgi:N-acetylglucosamine kinase-like BadF-type ATPase